VPNSSPLIAYQPEAIWSARRAFFEEGREVVGQIGDAVMRSWRRCNDQGRRVQDAVEFAPVDHASLQLLMERNRALLQVAQPELGSLARSVSDAGYAALLTDARGHALAVEGAISSHSAPLRHAFRAGVDLSEASIGTNARVGRNSRFFRQKVT
jgi:sigma-54 dependent transcriptional regulator, acetoin dehydrogenase operon transcriptional activator AcoR